MIVQVVILWAVCTRATAVSLYYDSNSLLSWESYKQVHQKVYKSNEDTLRRLIWKSNVEYITKHNRLHDLGLKSYTVGLNEYSDWTVEEWVKYLKGFLLPSHAQTELKKARYRTRVGRDLPPEIDWRQRGYVTPVKNQGRCGSCWSFSSTGALEGQHFRRTGQLVSLSEQNLIDCTMKKPYGNYGCGGGWMNAAFRYVRDNRGIDKETAYSYDGRDDKCRYRPSAYGAEDYGYVAIPRGDEATLQDAVGHVGPVAVAIDATHRGFILYKQGVYDEPACSNVTTDHAVLVVGYGSVTSSSGARDYWLVKNSWGVTWGDRGYIKMSRNKDNQCAIATYASYPAE